MNIDWSDFLFKFQYRTRTKLILTWYWAYKNASEKSHFWTLKIKQIKTGNLQWHFHEVALHSLFPERIRIYKCWFLWREENWSTLIKTLGPRTKTNNKLNPHMTPDAGIEPGTHWWEASALVTAPSLLPEMGWHTSLKNAETPSINYGWCTTANRKVDTMLWGHPSEKISSLFGAFKVQRRSFGSWYKIQ